MILRRLAFVLLLTWAAAAQAPPPQTPDPNSTQKTKPEDQCVLEGTVYSLKTGQPLRKAEIKMRRTDSKNPASYGASTDASGHYVVESLDPGKYDLSVSRNGYVTTSYGSEGKRRASTLITLSAGQHMTKVDVKMPSQAVVTGRVVDEDNEPMVNVTVQLMARGYQNGKRTLVSSEQSATNDKGEYRIFGVGPGRYWAMAHTGNLMMIGLETEVRSAKGGQTSYPATYYPGVLTLAEAAQVQITAGAEINGVDFHLTKVTSFTISGKILNASGPRQTMVQLMPRDADGAPSWDRMKMAMVDSEGKFAFHGVQPGIYDLSANIFSQDNRKSTHAEVPVSDGDVDVPLTFGENPDLKGTIRFEDESETTKTSFNLFLQPDGAVMGGASAETKEDGTFTLKSVAADRFRLNLYPMPEGHYIKSVQLGTAELDDTKIDLTNGIPGEIVVTLSAKGATVSGSIQDDKQAPVTSGTVVLVPDDRKLQSRYETATPDQNGQFTIKNVHPGSYKLFAFDNADFGAWLDADWLRPYETKGESIEVKESEKASKNLVVIVTDES